MSKNNIKIIIEFPTLNKKVKTDTSLLPELAWEFTTREKRERFFKYFVSKLAIKHKCEIKKRKQNVNKNKKN